MDKKILLYVVLGILVIVLLVLTIFPNMIYIVKDSGFTGNSISNSEDKCSAPEGISVEDWEEHMSHHPNLYKDCLE